MSILILAAALASSPPHPTPTSDKGFGLPPGRTWEFVETPRVWNDLHPPHSHPTVRGGWFK